MNFLQGLSRPMRLAGVALIGIAAIAAVIGIVTAVSGGGDNTAAPPAPSASSGPNGGGSSSAPASPPPASSTTPSPTTPPPGSPPPGAPGTPPADGQPGQGGPTPPPANGGTPADQSAAKWVPVRVYNNSTISGLAARAANDLRGGGWNVAEIANYPYGVIPTTTAYYTPGTDEETAAKAMAAAFSMKAEPRFGGIQNASGGVILIVTNDYQGLHAKGS